MNLHIVLTGLEEVRNEDTAVPDVEAYVDFPLAIFILLVFGVHFQEQFWGWVFLFTVHADEVEAEVCGEDMNLPVPSNVKDAILWKIVRHVPDCS